MGYPVTCPECNGNKGWQNIDSTWVECFMCNGTGSVDEDDLLEDNEDEDD